MRILEQISLLPDDHGCEGLQEAIKFLPLVERLYNDDVLFPIARWLPKVQFLAYLATHECFDDFVISTITQARSTIYATVILREACSLGLSLETANGDCLPSRLVEALMSMGADAHARGVIGGPFFRTPEPFLSNETAFTNVLRFCVKSLFLNLYDDVDFAPRVLRSVVGMAATCPDLSAKVLAPVRVWRNGAVTLEKFPPGEVIFRPFLGFFPLILELDLKFLLSYLLSELACFDEDHTTTSQIEELLPKLENPTAKLRYVAFQGKESSNSTCGCVLSQESCPEIIERLFERGKNQLGSSEDAEDPEDTESTYGGIRRMAECLSVERVDHESMMLSLANENLGVCTFVEAGIKPPVAWLDAVEQDHLYPFPRILEKLRASAGTEDDV